MQHSWVAPRSNGLGDDPGRSPARSSDRAIPRHMARAARSFVTSGFATAVGGKSRVTRARTSKQTWKRTPWRTRDRAMASGRRTGPRGTSRTPAPAVRRISIPATAGRRSRRSRAYRSPTTRTRSASASAARRARGLPLPREDLPLRPRAHPRAGRARPWASAPTATSRTTSPWPTSPAPTCSSGPVSRRRRSSASRPSPATRARPISRATCAASRSSSTPKRATGTSSATTSRSSSSRTRSSSPT